MTEPAADVTSARPKPSVPGRLLASLVSANTLVQPEVALTRATRFLLGLPNAAGALDQLVARNGLHPQPDGYWLTEVWAEGGGRTDLEYRWGESETVQVIVEAKIGHRLGADQLDDYRSRLGDDGLLVVLVPASRTREARAVVDELRDRYKETENRVRVDLWIWDEVATELTKALPGSVDVAQLVGLIETTGALDIRPFDQSEFLTSDESRFQDLWTVLDRASFKLGDAVLNAQTSRGRFERWRYVEVGAYDALFTVGIGRKDRTAAEPWVWARIPDEGHLARASQDAVKSFRPDAIRDGDGLAFPLSLEPDCSGFELTELLRDQLKMIAKKIGDGLRAAYEAIPATDIPVDHQVLTPLVGMPGFAPHELLDSNRDRRRDIETLVRQAHKHVLYRERVDLRKHEPFALRSWIQVEPFLSHLSVGIERTDESTSPHPWAWLTVHEVTPNFEHVVSALEHAFPGQVEAIPKGRGVPLDLATGRSGVEAFHAVVHQIEMAKTTVRAMLSQRTLS